MHFDMTVNIGDVLTVLAMLGTIVGVFWKLDRRIVLLETFVHYETERTDRALTILETVGESLAKFAALYEGVQGRVDRLENAVERHHTNVIIHSPHILKTTE